MIAELRERRHDISEAGEYGVDPIVNAVGTDRATRINHAVTDPRAHPDDWGSAGQP